MLHVTGLPSRLCDRLTRREVLRIGGIGALGLSLADLTRGRTLATPVVTPSSGRAKHCIVLFLLGGPPQHSTWDPKPDTPAEVRGEFGPISTNVPGMQICELLPRSAQLADRLCLLRAVHTGDNAHSSSGYYMFTGVPHLPMNAENVNPGAPNDWPNFGSVVRKLRPGSNSMPSAVRLPHHVWNTDGSIWPGQDAGFLGRANDPWLFRCHPGSPDFQIPEFSLPGELPLERLAQRRELLTQFDAWRQEADRGGLVQYDGATQQAFDLLTSRASREAFRLDAETDQVRDRYGRSQFGQSVLLARRLVEAGVGLVQVNWFRSPDEPSDAPCWDSHVGEAKRLKTVLAEPFDLAFSALVEDLTQRGMLDETLVLVLSEFGRSPRINAAGGRDHWGNVFSLALAGGGIRGGHVHGSSDALGGAPKSGRVMPPDLLATLFHALGIPPATEIHDRVGRPLPIARGEVLHEILS